MPGDVAHQVRQKSEMGKRRFWAGLSSMAAYQWVSGYGHVIEAERASGDT